MGEGKRRRHWVVLTLAVVVVSMALFMQLTGQGVRLGGRSTNTFPPIDADAECRAAEQTFGLSGARHIDTTMWPMVHPPYDILCTVQFPSGVAQQIGIPRVGDPVLITPNP